MTVEAFTALLSAICFVESSGRTNAIVVNDGGSPSYGECQVKLATAKMMGFKGTAAQLWLNREINRLYAAKYLRYQLARYKGDVLKAVSAYNAGKASGNKGYVNKVLKAWGERR